MARSQDIKKHFPFFEHNPETHYLDSTATALKPKKVIDAVHEYYEKYPVNIHRGIYALSEKATAEYEGARKKVAGFIGAEENEIIFTKNATESINLVAYALEEEIVEGDRILTSIMEHHANFVPWQHLTEKKKAHLDILGISENGLLSYALHGQPFEADLSAIKNVLTEKTKVVALVDTSNVLGTINPIKEIIAEIRKFNSEIIVVVDACQSVPHTKVDVKEYDCDFLAFSGHKMCGPTGIGVLYGKQELLEKMQPFLRGGDMVQEVYTDRTVYKGSPEKFEAGTPHIAGAIGLGAAVDFLNEIGLKKIHAHEQEIMHYAFEQLNKHFGDVLKIHGPKDLEKRAANIAFSFKEYHPHDIAALLDQKNVCIRVGQHCAMPLHESLEVFATARASFYLYSTKEDVDALVEGLKFVDETLSK